jgi:methyltransferase (TIGR00027 family)
MTWPSLSAAVPASDAMANPISRTAYYTLGVRAWDAAKPHPICGDTYASAFINDDAAQVWNEFKTFLAPNGSNAARHRIIDDHLRAGLIARPQSPVVIIGAGFDTRAFRLSGGRWFELDEPEILTYKESRLPAASAPNPLERIPIVFGTESIKDKLPRFADGAHVLVVIEGVLMYLSQQQRAALLTTLREVYPHHNIYCDLMRRSFFESYSRDIHQKIVGLGASFSEMVEEPEQLFLDHGYEHVASTSVALFAAERSSIGIPAFAIRWFLRGLRRGYSISVFHC